MTHVAAAGGKYDFKKSGESFCLVCSTRLRRRRRGRTPRYCGAACRQFALRNRNRARKNCFRPKAPERYEIAAKNSDKSVVSSGQIRGRGLRGPARVLAMELSRRWQPIVSEDGVSAEITWLRSRALIGGGA
jgi:hypothetical protein